ncbi:hypothetical protein [Novosphingobium resinovorum]|uniref:hypothetical protein n=1 Tax=Novosphingobium resinovorum TaxID=158500 RepID=UPI002ED598EB|nr:hypothetical protein [Novosphingobium resinovorum]
MAEEIVERTHEPAPVHTTTIIHEHRSSGGTGIILALILLVAIVGGVYLFSEHASDSARDNAIAEAADNVGKAATKVGDAAEEAVQQQKQ